jgi:hypothetical protein
MRVHVAAVCSGLLIACAASGADRLNIRPGEWEITSKTQMSGAFLPNETLAKMTPQQRAQLEASMREQANREEVERECVTEKEIQQPFGGADLEKNDCRQSMVQTSRTTQEVRFVCTGERKGSGVLKLNAPDPKRMTATVELRGGEGAETYLIRTQMSGRWLSDQCEEEDEDDSYDDESNGDYDEEGFDEDESGE